MEELINAVNRVADSVGGTLPLWASVAGLVVPIILTVVTIILSVRMDRQNKQLQKMLSNRDTMNQTRQSVLGIYNSYLTALNYATQANGNVAEIFVSDQSYYRWAQDIEAADADIIRSFNQAQLMIQDEELSHQIRDARDAFSQLTMAIKSYIYTGIPSQTVANAWAQFSPQYGIQGGNYYALMQNRTLAENFTKLCETSYTRDIQSKIERYIEVVGCDAFDEPFKKYVQINEI